MKKNLLCLTMALLMLLSLLGGCGASDSGAAADGGAYNGQYSAAEDVMEETEAAMDVETGSQATLETEEFYSETQNVSGIVSGEITGDLADKIIYSAYAELETTEFDKSIEAVYGLLDKYSAFLESSSVNGSNLNDTIYGTQSNRSATFTLRVPKENYSAMTAALDTVGNVIYLTNNAENITSQYTDTASRLAAYETEETRLLEIMAKAETVEDMIDLESRLSEIRYQKENLTSQLQNWDNQISYSSVDICINEVKVLTPEPQENPTYGQELKEAFIGSVKWMGRAGKALLKLLVEVIPVLAPLAVIVLVVILICVKRSKKKAQATQNQSEPESEKKT